MKKETEESYLQLWHDSGEEPKNSTEIIIVHDYFAHGFEQQSAI